MRKRIIEIILEVIVGGICGGISGAITGSALILLFNTFTKGSSYYHYYIVPPNVFLVRFLSGVPGVLLGFIFGMIGGMTAKNFDHVRRTTKLSLIGGAIGAVVVLWLWFFIVVPLSSYPVN